MVTVRKFAVAMAPTLITLGLATPPRVSAADVAPDASATAGGADQIQEITVTAQRRAENLHDVPIAITAIGNEQMAASGINNTLDLPTLVPGLTFNNSVGLGSPYLRGIGSTTDGVGTTNPVATYVDGVYMPSKAASIENYADIERIEVDKGPQGTLFGRNATGGLIQVITRDPSSEPSGMAKVGYGNYNTASGSFYLTGGLLPDVAANISGYTSYQRDGWGINLHTGNDTNRDVSTGVRTKIVYTASEATRITFASDFAMDRTSIGVAYRQNGDIPLALGPPFTGGEYDINQNVDTYVHTRDYGGSLKVQHDFGSFELNSISAFRATQYELLLDETYAPVDVYNQFIDIYEHAFSQELQVVGSASGGLQWQAGTFAFFTRNDQAATLYGTLFSPLQAIVARSKQPVQSYAVYGQATKDLPFDSKLTLGARYTYERHRLEAFNVLNFDATTSQGTGFVDKTGHFDKPTWRIVLEHDFSRALNGYVSYNRGFDSGLFNSLSPASPAVQPEVLDDYEAGIKSYLLDRRVELNAAYFHYKYSNIQLSKYVNGLQVLTNAAGAKADGVDLDFRAAITPALHISGGGEYLDAVFTSFPDAPISEYIGPGYVFTPGDASGLPLPIAPKWTGNVTADYTWKLAGGDADASLTYMYNSGYSVEADNKIREGSYSLVNAAASWAPGGGRFKVTLWGKNLTDRFHSTSAGIYSFGAVLAAAPPRQYGANIQMNF